MLDDHGFAGDLDSPHLRCNRNHVVAGPLVGGYRAAVQSPERLEPPLAVEALVVLRAGAVQHAAESGDGAEGVGALGPGAPFRVVEVETVGEHDDALFGDLDVHCPLLSTSAHQPNGKGPSSGERWIEPDQLAVTLRDLRASTASVTPMLRGPRGEHAGYQGAGTDARSVSGPRQSDERPAGQPVHPRLASLWCFDAAATRHPGHIGSLVHQRHRGDGDAQAAYDPRLLRISAAAVRHRLPGARTARPRGRGE